MDEIKRKLAVIEGQLPGQSLHARLIGTAPLLFPALGLMAGIVLQHIVETQPFASPHAAIAIWTWAILLGLSATVTCGCYLRIRHRPRPQVLAYGAALCFVCLGAIRLISFAMPASNDLQRLVGEERVLATIRGHVLTPPYQQQADWCFAQFTFSDPSTTFYMKVDQAQTAQGWAAAGGTIRVHVDEPTLNLRTGDRIQVYCWLHRFNGPTNPGQFDVAAYLRRRNVYLGASVPSRDAIELWGSARRDVPGRLREWLSDAASQALLGQAPPDTPAAGLLQALLLGDRRDIDRDTYEAFRRTGLLHFISLSGMHLGIFVGIVWWLGKMAGLTKRARAVVCIVATAVFLLVVPPRAPTVRAAVIVWVYCLALILRRRTNPLNSLCLAAIILLLIRPTQLFEAGWQLSFAAVAGILALTGRVEESIHDRTHGWFRRRDHQARPFLRLVKGAGGAAIRLFSAGLAAWVGGTGILLYHFYTIAPLTSLWTVLVFPLVAAILTMGFFQIILFFLLPTLGSILGILVSFGADLLIWTVKIIARLDINCILIGHVAVGVVVAYYGLVLLASFARTRHVALKKWLCLTWVLILIGYLGVVKWQRTHRDHLCLTALDVGHGQAILARLPGTKNILFDAGSLYTPDVGVRIVVPFLDYVGIGRIDSVLISHNDIDHINGIPEVVSARRVDHIYANDAFFARSQGEQTAERLIECLRKRSREIERMPQTVQAAGATISTLWPVDEPLYPGDLSDNDRSLVSLIEFRATSVLLCSDIEQFAQQQIMALHPELHATIVVSPHHGSPTTLDERFMESLEPEVLICSGSRSDYQRRRDRSEAVAPKEFHTGQNGAISVCVETSDMIEGKIRVRTYEGE